MFGCEKSIVKVLPCLSDWVNILTCGTCLDFYGIKEKLAVGSVTNMYEIVEKMQQSQTIIRP